MWNNNKGILNFGDKKSHILRLSEVSITLYSTTPSNPTVCNKTPTTTDPPILTPDSPRRQVFVPKYCLPYHQTDTSGSAKVDTTATFLPPETWRFVFWKRKQRAACLNCSSVRPCQILWMNNWYYSEALRWYFAFEKKFQCSIPAELKLTVILLFQAPQCWDYSVYRPLKTVDHSSVADLIAKTSVCRLGTGFSCWYKRMPTSNEGTSSLPQNEEKP